MTVTAEQQRLLVAMGIEPLLLVCVQPVAHAGGAAESAGDIHGAAAPVAAPAAVGAAMTALGTALKRAAGGSDISPLQLDLAQLRQQPQLKRALWPRLRELRRGLR